MVMANQTVMKKYLIVLVFIKLMVAGSYTQETVIEFEEYKAFLFYTRDSIARHLLSLVIDDFNDRSYSNESEIINWKEVIDYRDEEILHLLTNYCRFYERDYLYNYIQERLIVDSERLFKLFPAWTSEGTVVQPKQDVDYFIYAKSGSVGNVYNLSGYLKTKKGEILIFSFMNNHYRKPTIEIKNYMYSFLNMVREKY